MDYCQDMSVNKTRRLCAFLMTQNSFVLVVSDGPCRHSACFPTGSLLWAGKVSLKISYPQHNPQVSLNISVHRQTNAIVYLQILQLRLWYQGLYQCRYYKKYNIGGAATKRSSDREAQLLSSVRRMWASWPLLWCQLDSSLPATGATCLIDS
jgi:hypothetical protein